MKVFIAIVLLLVVSSISMCGYNLYSAFNSFPEEARIENLRTRYSALISDLDHAIEKSESTFSLANKLENIDYPDELLSVAMQNNTDDELSIINRFEPTEGSNTKLRMLLNGGGYGQDQGQHYLIYQHPLNKYEYDHIELLFKREMPIAE